MNKRMECYLVNHKESNLNHNLINYTNNIKKIYPIELNYKANNILIKKQIENNKWINIKAFTNRING